MTDTWDFEALGTAWSIETIDAIDQATRRQVTTLIEAFDRTWSRFRPDSVVSRLRNERSVDLGADAPALLGIYDELFELTAGAVNPCVGASLEQLGYDPAYSLTPQGEPIRPVSWTDCSLNGTTLAVPGPVVLDVGAAGKGFLVDRIADELAQPCIVDGSGDIVNRSGSTIRVALEHPKNPKIAVGVANVADGQAICGSAVNRRVWGDGVHHVLDARTGAPTRDILSSWVVADSAAHADAYATALFFIDAAAIAERAGVGWATVDAHLRVRSGRLPGELFV